MVTNRSCVWVFGRTVHDRVQSHLNKREGAVEFILSLHYSLEDSTGVSQADSEKITLVAI